MFVDSRIRLCPTRNPKVKIRKIENPTRGGNDKAHTDRGNQIRVSAIAATKLFSERVLSLALVVVLREKEGDPRVAKVPKKGTALVLCFHQHH